MDNESLEEEDCESDPEVAEVRDTCTHLGFVMTDVPELGEAKQ